MHQRSKIVPVRQCIRKLLNQRLDLNTANRKARIVSQTFLIAKPEYLPLTAINTAGKHCCHRRRILPYSGIYRLLLLIQKAGIGI